MENATLQAKVGKKIGNDIETYIRAPQGDCLSPILFISYLAEALKPMQAIEQLPHISDHTYAKTDNVMISQQYADDTSWITSNKQMKEELKAVVPRILKSKNLQANESKTEEYEIIRGGKEKWKKFKYLGSLLDTEADTKRRKVLVHEIHIGEQERKSRNKIRIFKSHIESIFRYSCELWIFTKKQEDIIDACQRIHYGKSSNIRWPEKFSNSALYERTMVSPWSKIVKKRGLTWYAHLLPFQKRHQ